MIRTGFLTNCPKCGYIAEAWTEGGIILKIHCHMCGYQGDKAANPDLENMPWRV